MTSNDPGEVTDSGGDPRLSSLEDRLKAAHRAEAERTASIGAGASFDGKGTSQGNRVLSTLIGIPLGSLVVGFALDQVFDTRPKGMLVLLFLGIITAFVQIMRIAREKAE